MSDVIVLDLITTHDIPAERVLNKALEYDLDQVVILGYRKNGDEYFASSIADGGSVLWLMERLKLQLLKGESHE